MPELHWRSGRADIDLKVDLKTDDASFVAVTKNISAGGMFVATPRVRAVGERLTLTFPLPGASAPISVAGEVRWKREELMPGHEDRVPGMGLRFVNLPVGAAIAIEALVRELEQGRRNSAPAPKP